VTKLHNFIDGELADPADGATEEVPNPATGEVIATAPLSSAEDYVEPTVIAGMQQQYEMIQSEIFGPAITVQRFDDEAKAIGWGNGTRYGLASSVFTGNVGRAMRVARALRFGAVWVNDHITVCSEMPHGGFKQFGYGKDMSIYGVEDYTEINHVMINLE
jgi:betaine-aldehyde dehydrogenase